MYTNKSEKISNMKQDIYDVLTQVINNCEKNANDYAKDSPYAYLSGLLSSFIRNLPDCEENREYIQIFQKIQNRN